MYIRRQSCRDISKATEYKVRALRPKPQAYYLQGQAKIKARPHHSKPRMRPHYWGQGQGRHFHALRPGQGLTSLLSCCFRTLVTLGCVRTSCWEWSLQVDSPSWRLMRWRAMKWKNFVPSWPKKQSTTIRWHSRAGQSPTCSSVIAADNGIQCTTRYSSITVYMNFTYEFCNFCSQEPSLQQRKCHIPFVFTANFLLFFHF